MTPSELARERRRWRERHERHMERVSAAVRRTCGEPRSRPREEARRKLAEVTRRRIGDDHLREVAARLRAGESALKDEAAALGLGRGRRLREALRALLGPQEYREAIEASTAARRDRR